MATFHVMGGYLNVEGMSGGYPDNGCRGRPVDPGYGISSDRPANPIVLPPDTAWCVADAVPRSIGRS